jgi:hypothetical protein
VDFVDAVVIPEEGDFEGKVPAHVWCQAVLDSIGFFLCSDSDGYCHETLYGMVEVFLGMSSERKAHRLADTGVAATLLERMKVLSHSPCHRLDEGRNWFINTQTKLAPILGVTALTTATATLKYSWYGTPH